MKGVVAVLTKNNGAVVATACSFEQTPYGGFSLERSQEIRAENTLAVDFMKNFSSPYVNESLDSDHCRHIVEQVCDKQGFKKRYIHIDTVKGAIQPET